MKKLFAALFVCVLSYVVMATAPAYSITDGNYQWGVDPASGNISTAAAFDTLSGVDSVTLLNNFNAERGYEYILVRDAITGGGTDSLFLQVRCDAKDGSGNLLYSVAVDSMTAAAGEAIVLPIGGASIGHKYDVKLIGYGDNGGEVIINRVLLYQRRVQVIDRNYR